MVKFNCKAITNAITILPNGRIAPCCVIKNYSKPIELLNDKNRFVDLQTDEVPTPCTQCVKYPQSSYKRFFNQFSGDHVQHLDFRNSTLCNMKCRTCGPHASSSWASELGAKVSIIKSELPVNFDEILTEHLKEIYFAGGEPLLNPDHWMLLQKLDQLDLAHKIRLKYNTNLTVTTYKNISAFDIWKKFKNVEISVSVDAVGKSFDFIRSGGDWSTVSNNIAMYLNETNVTVTLNYTLSAISVWFLPDVLKYAEENNLFVHITQLTDPHYYTLNVLPDELAAQCVNILNKCKAEFPKYSNQIDLAISVASNNDDQSSFVLLMSNILMADKIRNESLFDLLPFKQSALSRIYANQ